MLTRFFNFASSRNRKSNRRRSRGRRLRGIEHLEAREMMTAVPAHSSLSGAPVTIYLDFDGHHEDEWGETYSSGPDAQIWTDVNTPVFSHDADLNFNAAEVDMIHKIWKCVAEDFAPFNINVTTQLPPASEMAHTIRVAIGGGWDDWFGESAGGISITGSFNYGEYVNTVYVFSDEFTTARTIADCASQEIGHSFGLDHQRVWNYQTGEIIEEYNPGTLESAPIMGVPYNSQRSLWWKETRAGSTWHLQDDMQIMEYANPLIDFRADDHGGTVGTATYISNVYGTTKGIIATNAQNTGMFEDRDAFIVTLPSAGLLKHWVASVEVDGYSANLDAKLEVYKFSYTPGTKNDYGKNPPPPTLLGIVDPGTDLGAAFDLGGAGGSFLIVVRSHGDYGDLGQYALKFYNSNISVANTDPITLPPIIDVICDPLMPVAPTGRVLTPKVATPLQLNLAALDAAPKRGDSFATGELKLASSSAPQSPTPLAALDEAFAQFDIGSELKSSAVIS